VIIRKEGGNGDDGPGGEINEKKRGPYQRVHGAARREKKIQYWRGKSIETVQDREKA